MVPCYRAKRLASWIKASSFAHEARVEVLAFDDLRHGIRGRKAFVVDSNDRNHAGDVFDESLVALMQGFEIRELDIGFHPSAAHLDAFHRGFGRDVEVDDDTGFAHEVTHVLEELLIGPVVPRIHEARLREHARKDGVLVDGPVLHRRCAFPDDLLVLLKSAIEQVDLHRKRVAFGVGIKVFEVVVVGDRLVVRIDAEVLTKCGGKRGLARSDHAGDTNEDIAENAFFGGGLSGLVRLFAAGHGEN